jgi:hypothetical protein
VRVGLGHPTSTITISSLPTRCTQKLLRAPDLNFGDALQELRVLLEHVLLRPCASKDGPADHIPAHGYSPHTVFAPDIREARGAALAGATPSGCATARAIASSWGQLEARASLHHPRCVPLSSYRTYDLTARTLGTCDRCSCRLYVGQLHCLNICNSVFAKGRRECREPLVRLVGWWGRCHRREDHREDHHEDRHLGDWSGRCHLHQ